VAQVLDVQIELPEGTPEETIQLASLKAREAAILVLQQEGQLSIREAAAELGRTYEGYLDLLAERGLPATHDTTTPETMEKLRHSLGLRKSTE
jgi:hypothetical protein